MTMKEFYKIDPVTGLILDMALLDDEGDILDDMKPGWGGDRGFHNPIWGFDTDDWIEGKSKADMLEIHKTTKINELNALCEETIYAGFKASNGHEYEFEDKDQTNISQSLLLASMDVDMSDIEWKTLDAGIVVHTRGEFIKMCIDAEAHKRGNISKYWKLKESVEAAATNEEINKIVW